MSSVIFTWSSRITLGLLASWLCAATASAAVITVTTDLDAPLANDGECTLREAITNAQVNSTAGSTDCVAGGAIDEIVFSTYFDTPRTINLVSNLPFLSGHMTVSGPGLANLTISGGGTHRIFIVSDADGTPNSSVTIRDLTLRDGLADGNGGGAIVSLELLTLTRLRLENNNAGVGSGGAVRLQAGTLLVQNSLFKGNSAPDASFGLGGAISASNLTTSLQIVSSVFDGNSAQLGGGAVYSLATNTTAFNSTFARNTASANLGGGALNVPGASLSIDRSWITENSVGAPAGGIQFTGNTLTLTRTTLDNNIATRGSGVSHAGNGTSSLRNNTFSGNQSTFGSGALSVADTAQAVVQFNTFYGNSASGGGRAVQNIGFGTVSIEASLLVTGNTSTNLCGGTMTVSGRAGGERHLQRRHQSRHCPVQQPDRVAEQRRGDSHPRADAWLVGNRCRERLPGIDLR
jgi:CSLREA domain-containing protein